MGLLSQEDQLKYRLLHGHTFIALCDKCGKLIQDLYVVNSWRKRKDRLTFLGAIPTDVTCLTCDGVARGTIKMVDDLPVVKEVKGKKDIHDIDSTIRRGLLHILQKYPDDNFDTNALILRLYKKSKYRDCKKSQIRKTLKAMKVTLGELKKSKGFWKLKEKKRDKANKVKVKKRLS